MSFIFTLKCWSTTSCISVFIDGGINAVQWYGECSITMTEQKTTIKVYFYPQSLNVIMNTQGILKEHITYLFIWTTNWWSPKLVKILHAHSIKFRVCKHSSHYGMKRIIINLNMQSLCFLVCLMYTGKYKAPFNFRHFRPRCQRANSRLGEFKCV